MEPLIHDFIYFTIERITLGFMSYIPFWDHLKINRAIFSVILCVGILMINTLLVFTEVPGIISMIIFLGMSAIFYIFTIDAPLGKKVFVFMIVTSYAAMIHNLVLYFSYNFWPEYYTVHYNLYEVGILTASFVVTFPILGGVMRSRIKPVLNQSSPSFIWRLMWIIPAVFSMSILLFSYVTDTNRKDDATYILATLILMVGAFTVYYFLLQLFNGLRESAMMEERVKMTQSQLAMQYEQFEMIQETIDRVRMARHDMHHHLNIIYGLMRKKDYGSLEDHMIICMESIPKLKQRCCENHAVDAIISYYYYMTERSDIVIDMDVVIPASGDPAYDSDISIIIGNLLENAIDAVQDVEDKKIKLTCMIRNKYLVIKVDNKFNGIWEKNGDIFLSTKHEGYGLGIESIRNITSEHGGTTEFIVNNDQFSSSVIIEAKIEE